MPSPQQTSLDFLQEFTLLLCHQLRSHLPKLKCRNPPRPILLMKQRCPRRQASRERIDQRHWRSTMQHCPHLHQMVRARHPPISTSRVSQVLVGCVLLRPRLRLVSRFHQSQTRRRLYQRALAFDCELDRGPRLSLLTMLPLPMPRFSLSLRPKHALHPSAGRHRCRGILQKRESRQTLAC